MYYTGTQLQFAEKAIVGLVAGGAYMHVGHMVVLLLASHFAASCQMATFGLLLDTSYNSCQNYLGMVSVSYIPVKWDIRPIISFGKGQCLSEA